VGAWIETSQENKKLKGEMKSRPAWARGLKQGYMLLIQVGLCVAPCVGAWIESSKHRFRPVVDNVAPCVGAWIETSPTRTDGDGLIVAPCVGAWIETYSSHDITGGDKVAPCVGAWIETFYNRIIGGQRAGRALRGRVD